MIITVTGKSGSGKTTVSRMLKAAVGKSIIIDADKIGKSLLTKPQIKKKLVKSFSKGILSGSSISKKKLAEYAFRDRKSLAKLNNAVHPTLTTEIKKRIKKVNLNIIDAALYNELKLAAISDYTIVVKCNERIIKQRVTKEVYSRNKFFKQPSGIFINNSGTLSETKKQLVRIWKRMQSMQEALTR